jgi:hypothetical protein
MLATRVMIERTRNLVEPGLRCGACRPQAVRGREGGVCGGGNIRPAQLMALWPRGGGLTAKQVPVEAGSAAITAARVLSI